MAKKVNIKCYLCGREEKIYPSEIQDRARFRCNNCCGGR